MLYVWSPADALTLHPTALRQQQLLTVSLPLAFQHLAQTSRGIFGKAERVSRRTQPCHTLLTRVRHVLSGRCDELPGALAC